MIFVTVRSEREGGVTLGEGAAQRAPEHPQTPTGLVHVQCGGAPDTRRNRLLTRS